MKSIKKMIVAIIDKLGSPCVLASCFILYLVRRAQIKNMPISKKIFQKTGVFPIIDHYYDPMFNSIHLKKSLRADRDLKGIDLNAYEQLELLEKYSFNDELSMIPINKTEHLEFYYHNGAFESGDAEYLYNIIRFIKPIRLVEVGSGFSTLLAKRAIDKNKENDKHYNCEHICIEPYEHQWLERLDIKVVRDIVENVDKRIFETLDRHDILFIDSSHIIRPQGDVLFEYLEILPLIKPGVIVHIHDIFTPKDYLNEWIIDEIKFWNEQYLLEAFLSFNKEFKVIAALNYLKHNHPQNLAAKCPIFAKEINYREPGSFWITRR